MRVHIATDHAGMELSAHLVEHLTAAGYEMVDHGPTEYDAQDDYPGFCINAARAVVADRAPGDVRDDVADGGRGQLGGLSVEGQGEGAHAISFRRACSSSRIRPAAQGASRIP